VEGAKTQEPIMSIPSESANVNVAKPTLIHLCKQLCIRRIMRMDAVLKMRWRDVALLDAA
jgi:hypothetical protein